MKRNQESLYLKKQLKEFLKRYSFSLIFILFMANIGLLIIIRLYGKAQECFTPEAISSDSRCLYIYSGKVYEKGTRDTPHNGHPCGQDVTSILPPSHLAAVVTYLDPNYKGDMCTAVSPTATEVPTQPPLPTDTPEPTATLQPTSPPQSTAIPIPSTTVPVVPTSFSQPSVTSSIISSSPFSPSPTAVSTVKVQCLVPPPVLNLRIDCPLCGN